MNFICEIENNYNNDFLLNIGNKDNFKNKFKDFNQSRLK